MQHRWSWTAGTNFATCWPSRRARITPERAGLPGHIAPGVSESVLEALAQALQLDEAERGYRFA